MLLAFSLLPPPSSLLPPPSSLLPPPSSLLTPCINQLSCSLAAVRLRFFSRCVPKFNCCFCRRFRILRPGKRAAQVPDSMSTLLAMCAQCERRLTSLISGTRHQHGKVRRPSCDAAGDYCRNCCASAPVPDVRCRGLVFTRWETPQLLLKEKRSFILFAVRVTKIRSYSRCACLDIFWSPST